MIEDNFLAFKYINRFFLFYIKIVLNLLFNYLLPDTCKKYQKK